MGHRGSTKTHDWRKGKLGRLFIYSVPTVKPNNVGPQGTRLTAKGSRRERGGGGSATVEGEKNQLCWYKKGELNWSPDQKKKKKKILTGEQLAFIRRGKKAAGGREGLYQNITTSLCWRTWCRHQVPSGKREADDLRAGPKRGGKGVSH